MLVNLIVPSVPRCIDSIVTTLELKHLQFPEKGASGGLPDEARIVHHRTDQLLVQQKSIPDG